VKDNAGVSGFYCKAALPGLAHPGDDSLLMPMSRCSCFSNCFSCSLKYSWHVQTAAFVACHMLAARANFSSRKMLQTSDMCRSV